MANIRDIRFITTEEGCFIPISHKLNQDGYFRKRWNVAGKTIAEMFHRFMWRARKGDIPEGYEINHKCGCRSCSNVEHLECIPGSAHATLTNKERYVDRQEQIVAMMLQNKTVDEMVAITGRTRCSVLSYRSRYNRGNLGIMKKQTL